MKRPSKPCAFCGGLIPEDDTNYRKKKYCNRAHYRAGEQAKKPARFWAGVEKGPGCWLWARRTDKSGYGRVDRCGPYTYAHRVAWILTNGPVPDGMDVMHTCDIRSCCNPAHLKLGTHEENMLDCKQKRRHQYGERSFHAKLTEEQVIALLANPPKRGPGGGVTQRAAELGVTDGAISAILAGRSWKHVPRSPEECGDLEVKR